MRYRQIGLLQTREQGGRKDTLYVSSVERGRSKLLAVISGYHRPKCFENAFQNFSIDPKQATLRC